MPATRPGSPRLIVVVVITAVAACSHPRTSCPDGTTISRLIYGGGHESEWCKRPDGVKQGPDVRYYESGARMAEGTFVDGVQHGLWRYYWNDGRVWREDRWEDGEVVWKKVDPLAAALTADQAQGLGATSSRVIKLASQDPLLHRRRLQEGGRTWTGTYPNGRKKVEGRYDDAGERVGVWRFWSPSGALEREIEYQGGARNRAFREWGDNGRLRIEGWYFSGEKDGRWQHFDDDGRLVLEEEWQLGTRIWDEKRQPPPVDLTSAPLPPPRRAAAPAAPAEPRPSAPPASPAAPSPPAAARAGDAGAL